MPKNQARILTTTIKLTRASGPTIVHEPRPDTPTGSRPRGPKRVPGRHRIRFEKKDGEELFNQQKQRSHITYRLDDDSSGVSKSLASLELYYAREELESFLAFRLAGLSRYSLGWPRRAAAAFWECTQGSISKAHTEALRTYALDKFHSSDTQAKFLYYARAFLSYLTKTKLDARYESFKLFLDLPKAVKTRKLVTGRIVTIEDIQNVLASLKVRYSRGELDERHYVAYKALIIFGAFTGQRSDATIGRITVGQFEEALKFRSSEPTLHVSADQDKIRMAHYVPLHPRVIEAVEPLLDGKKGSEIMFPHSALNQGSGVLAKQGTKYRSVVVVRILYSVIFANSASSMATLSAGINQIELTL